MVNAPPSLSTPDSPAATEKHAHVLVLRPSPGWVSLELGGLWEYRELLVILTWRDIAVRYKQTGE
jgi:lipopolysaccharide transport system permease protein